jgi:hypothetical protein
MYFWNIDQLVQELRAGTLSEYEKMKYLLASILLQLYAMSNTRLLPQNGMEMIIGALIFGVMVGVTVWGVYHCFIINKQNDNKNFIERFVCLGFPIGVRLAVYALAGLFILLFTVGLLGLLFFSPEIKSQVIVQGAGASAVSSLPTTGKLIINNVNYYNHALFIASLVQLLFFIVLSLIYYILLGRKIAEVSKKD